MASQQALQPLKSCSAMPCALARYTAVWLASALRTCVCVRICLCVCVLPHHRRARIVITLSGSATSNGTRVTSAPARDTARGTPG